MTQKPIFIQPLSSCTVAHGAVARFHALVSGTPPLHLDWFHNQDPVQPDKNVVFHFDEASGRRPADLLLLFTETQSGAELRAAFSDTEDFVDLGLALSISSWTENMKPSFTKKLKLQSVLEGEPVEMRCKLTAFPPPTVLWFHNNRSIPKERRRRIYTNSSMHMHTTALVISGVKEKDSGSYKVMALNSEGSAESTASLLVSLREEQSANYLNLARLTHKAHEHVNTTAEQRKEQKFRVELRCVGSPFDKMSKAHRGKARSKHALVPSTTRSEPNSALFKRQ
uniref:Ig-like domain-containing protein n=1 Tax=Gouania willdenowi TaxID=441366 RepID=A0A8C5DVA8_GOUWI